MHVMPRSPSELEGRLHGILLKFKTRPDILRLWLIRYVPVARNLEVDLRSAYERAAAALREPETAPPWDEVRPDLEPDTK